MSGSFGQESGVRHMAQRVPMVGDEIDINGFVLVVDEVGEEDGKTLVMRAHHKQHPVPDWYA